MLTELSIRNFAIIDALSISLEKGLTVLTGETGAGKSIIIDAIHLLVGGRGSAEFIRHGESKAEIEGLFIIDEEKHPVYEKMQEIGIDITDGMVVLRRDIALSGKSACRVNGKLVTIAILREIGRTLIDIHGQHEHQELMDDRLHLPLLDQFGGEKIVQALSEYQRLYKDYDYAVKQLKKLSQNEQQMVHRLDLIQFQHDEIESAELVLGEDDSLTEEKKKINNFERLHESLQTGYQSLTGEQRGLDWLSLAMNNLEEAAALDESTKGISESISNSYFIIEDAVSLIRDQLDSLEYDPERLDLIESRLNEINQLKRKYGKTIEEIVEYGSMIEEEIETLQNRETHIVKLEAQIKSIRADLLVEAKNLSELRQTYAKQLTNHIQKELQELYMEKTIFEAHFHKTAFTFTDADEVGKNGLDSMEFYISTNPGEPLKPLSKIASGGELSRIMLALKSIFSKHQGITSIIFDEVDTGVSGRVAQAIAEKIHQVASGSQVLCISHLPQVAAMADIHLFIAKNIKDGRTNTSVKSLNEEDKIKEIGRMISGVEITDLTKEHARELILQADQKKYVK
ncbi:DNA repair protein RecN [Peribacillus psychrosaccharolyticus]|uniref:DNA repair protein RecN n=1 Tax=Peribacillus psychrosaccharolyticus TaxID=1407 RepID=A0A974NLN4_PERPY|nr:DNA repair protein RecN [Peribacillus psychrosaccharolyticus]MEC2056862.1 DNA repair protein RecN [Peribacillus psychrosaccharolyticus]MED3746444.1 DNA repair protein RecN [Peribacillus psychrosaccharolyticus]QQT00016.1 DNA repair protein RecN [Peribacillus psychrosaccharolyticus]